MNTSSGRVVPIQTVVVVYLLVVILTLWRIFSISETRRSFKRTPGVGVTGNCRSRVRDHVWWRMAEVRTRLCSGRWVEMQSVIFGLLLVVELVLRRFFAVSEARRARKQNLPGVLGNCRLRRVGWGTPL